MPGNTFGELFRVTNWGESHGQAIGAVIDGCPPQLELSEKEIQAALDRRRPGQSSLTTPRKEKDIVEILSGVHEGKTTGAPISLMIRNTDQRKQDYSSMQQVYRPSHADFTYEQKYGIRDPYGGGRSSARLTAGDVAAGAIAEKFLRQKTGTSIVAYVKQVKDIAAEDVPDRLTRKQVDATEVRCPDKKAAEKMKTAIQQAREEGDSLGGVIECVILDPPAGLGEPLFDKLDADLAKAMLSINATKGFEIGSGFEGTRLTGSQHNDPFVMEEGKVKTRTNNAGGILGGISTGMPIIFRVAFKPTSTIAKRQETISKDRSAAILEAKGRHDPCVLPRAVPIVEAMAALVLCDHYLRDRALTGERHGT